MKPFSINLTPEQRTQLKKDFADAINRLSLENKSNTPDFIIANFLVNVFENFNFCILERNDWFWRPENDNSPRVINPMEPNSADNDDD